MARIVEDASFDRARNHIATLALSMYQIHGLPAPSSDELGSVVARAEASMSLHQLRHPESISASAIGQIDQLVMSAADAKKRPTNIYSADAARGYQGGDGKAAGKSLDALDRLRSSPTNLRYREAYGDGGTYAGRPDGGARYDMIGSPEWRTERGLAITRGYALNNDMAWATKQPDLMRMGQPALQALHEVHLKGDGYESLHSKGGLNFDNPTIVAGAAYMKRNHGDYNEAAKAAAALNHLKQLTPEERARNRDAERRLLNSKPGKSEDAAKRGYIEDGDKLIANHHGDRVVRAAVERARRAHHVQKGLEHKAEVKALSTEEKDKAADIKAKNDQKAAGASKSRAAALLGP